jgi:hypothetical protein
MTRTKFRVPERIVLALLFVASGTGCVRISPLECVKDLDAKQFVDPFLNEI